MDEKCTLSDNKPNLRQQSWSVAVQQSGSPVVQWTSSICLDYLLLGFMHTLHSIRFFFRLHFLVAVLVFASFCWFLVKIRIRPRFVVNRNVLETYRYTLFYTNTHTHTQIHTQQIFFDTALQTVHCTITLAKGQQHYKVLMS